MRSLLALALRRGFSLSRDGRRELLGIVCRCVYSAGRRANIIQLAPLRRGLSYTTHYRVSGRLPSSSRASLAENKMHAFIRRFLMHYGIYRRYPLGRFPALRNAWRAAQP